MSGSKTIGVIGPYGDTSGTGTFVRNLARGLDLQGYRVVVFSFNDIWQKTAEDGRVQILDFGPLTTEKIWAFGEFIAKESLLLGVELLVPQIKPELGVATLVAKQRLQVAGSNIPACGSWHSNFGWINDASYHLALAKLCIAYLDSILPVSLNVQEDITAVLGHEVPRTIVHSGGVNIEKITAYADDRSVFEPYFDPQHFIMVYVGRMLFNKGLDLLAEAMTLLPDRIRALMIGKGPFLDTFAAKAAEMGVADRMKFTGFLPDETVYRCLNSADLFVLPSRWESFNISALEAMAAGLPVVATRVGGLPFWVGDDGLLVEPENPQALAAGIIKMASDENYRNSMGLRAAELAKKYDWRHIARESAEAYEVLFKEPTTPLPEFTSDTLSGKMGSETIVFEANGHVTETTTTGEDRYIITRYGLFHPSEARENEGKGVSDPELLYRRSPEH